MSFVCPGQTEPNNFSFFFRDEFLRFSPQIGKFGKKLESSTTKIYNQLGTNYLASKKIMKIKTFSVHRSKYKCFAENNIFEIVFYVKWTNFGLI